MKKLTAIVFAILALFSMSITLINPKNEVAIGKQIWMSHNLDINTFRNGDSIPNAKTDEEWRKAGENKKPAWRYCNNDSTYGQKYGKLYNWYAVNDPRGLAPTGWHIPNDDEWITLIKFLGGKEIAGKKLKNTSGWDNNGNGNNQSGFSALPGAGADFTGYCSGIGDYSYWWSSTEDDDESALGISLESYSDIVSINNGTYKWAGYSIRCVRN